MFCYQRQPQNSKDLEEAITAFFEHINMPENLDSLKKSIYNLPERLQGVLANGGNNVDNKTRRRSAIDKHPTVKIVYPADNINPLAPRRTPLGEIQNLNQSNPQSGENLGIRNLGNRSTWSSAPANPNNWIPLGDIQNLNQPNPRLAGNLGIRSLGTQSTSASDPTNPNNWIPLGTDIRLSSVESQMDFPTGYRIIAQTEDENMRQFFFGATDE